MCSGEQLEIFEMLSDHDKSNIENFISSISLWDGAYSHAGFSYVALKRDGALHLISGRLFLHTAPSAIPKNHFQSNQVFAGYFLLSELGVDYRALIKQLTQTGIIKTPIGELIFTPDEKGKLSTYYTPFHRDGINAGKRLSYLKISGAHQHSYIKQPDIDWELKAGMEPFDSLNELMIQYSLVGTYTGDTSNIEVVAINVAEINFSSKVEEEKAEPSIYLAKGLDQKKCQIGFRVFSQGEVVSRGTIKGDKLLWSEEESSYVGTGKLDIPSGAALHCIASYEGCAQHQYWIADPKNFQNSRRVVMEECDKELKIMHDFLFAEQKARKDARDFEFGVAWLAWMLGFSVSQPGGTPRTSDSVDVIATTPSGNMALIECTTGLLKAGSKLANLVARTEAIKKRMQSGHNHLKILPVMVTALTREEVRSELEEAHKHGVAVITKEDLLETLSQTIVVSNSEVIFERLQESVGTQTEQLQFASMGG